MSQWVRLWEDMPNDPKWRLVARRARVPDALPCVTIRDVVTVFVHMLICAGIGKNRGVLDGWDDEVVAVAIDVETEVVAAIREAMDGLVLDGNRLRSWEKRQPNREDSSTERTRAFRAKRNPLKRIVTHVKHTVTQRDAPEEKRIDTDKDTELSRVRARARPNSTQKNKSPISENETANAQQMADADKFGLNTEEAVEVEFEKFRDYNLAKGTELSDWNAAWRNWLGKVGEYKPKMTTKRLNGHANQSAHPKQIFVEVGTPQWNAWDQFWQKSKGKGPPKDHNNRGWWFPTEYPPSSD